MKRFKKLAATALTVALCLLMSSCDGWFSINKTPLIKPPILFKEQEEVLKALKESTGDNISLEYPATGENRSAFFLCDMDNDGQNEAIAFYRQTVQDLPVDVAHINLLKKGEGESWSSVCDIVGAAASIDRVSVGSFSGKRELIIGWDLMRGKEKTLVCYSFVGNRLTRDYTANYVEFSVYDFWEENSGDELITINYSQSSENLKQPTQHARLITRHSGSFDIISSAPLDSRVTGYKQSVAGKVNEKKGALFLDGILDAATVNTQILVTNNEGRLQNPLLSRQLQTDTLNQHKPTLLTQDIDGDGILEVPHQQEVIGYESLPESEKIYKTIWKHLTDGELTRHSVMFISSLGVRITIPDSLNDMVTIKTSAADKEIAFFAFSESLEYSNDLLFSIRVQDRENHSLENGYAILKATDYKIVIVKLSDVGHALCPTWQTIYNAVEIV